jgi:Arc/MetJ family transcription regulator
MRVSITVNKELVGKVMEYTHSSAATEAVNIALKDWLVFHRMRELSKKLANNSMYINNRQHIQELII